MNILYTNFHVEDGGGHVTYILSLLKNTRHTLYVATPPTSRLYKTLEKEGFVNRIPLTFPSSLRDFGELVRQTRAFIRAVKEHDIDIVHTNGSPDNRMALYAWLLTGRRFRVVYTKHNTIKIKGIISLLRFNKFNDAVIFVSQSAKTDSGITTESSRYHIVEHGIDLDYWKRQTPVHTGARLRLVSNAGSVRTKGWIHLAEAIAELPEASQKRLSCVVLGRHEPVLEEMQGKANELCGMEFPGFFKDPRPVLEEGDIGFVLSYKEASSFASREMMAMSLPVISSDFPNHARNVDPSCGWVTVRKDAGSIRDALQRILQMKPDELTAMKHAARAKAEREFSLEKMIAETNAVYDAVMRR